MYKHTPNILSILRILSIPFLLLLFHRSQTGFLILFVAASATDALDGFVARRFGLVTKLGRQLDTIADNLFYSSMIYLAYLSTPDLFRENAVFIAPPLGLFVCAHLVGLIRKRRIVAFHGYSARLFAWAIFIFLLHVFVLGESRVLFISTCLIGIVYFSELIGLIVTREDVDESVTWFFRTD